MSSVPDVVEVLKDLIERADALGIEVEEQAAPLIESLQAAILRREAALRLRAAAERARALPDNEKPTQEQIDAEFEAYWATQEGK
jgi:hypothetical protein